MISECNAKCTFILQENVSEKSGQCSQVPFGLKIKGDGVHKDAH